MDKKLKMGPWADKKIWKTLSREGQKFEKCDLEVWDPLSPSLRGLPCTENIQLAWKVNFL